MACPGAMCGDGAFAEFEVLELETSSLDLSYDGELLLEDLIITCP
jgi:hypothetical protein